MANKMLIDATHPEETRVVVVRGNRVEDFDFEAASRRQLRGNIYLAKVTRVEPSLQAAFIDYGGNRHGFLAFSEIHPDYYQIPVADRQALIEAEEREAEEADAAHAAEQAARARRAAKRAAEAKAREATAAVSEDAPALDAEAPTAEEAADAAEDAAADAAAEEHSDDGHDDMSDDHQDDHHDDQPQDDRHDDQADNGHGGEHHDEENGGDPDEQVESVGAEDALEELPERRRGRPRQYKIQEVIKRRQVLLVQVVKEERGTKGAALTTYLSLAGRYSVLMPNTSRGGGISRKITNAVDRKRLKDVAGELEVPEGMGVILRTAGASRTKAEVKRDFEYLLRLWESVREYTLSSTAPTLVYEEGSLIKRSIRDLYNKDIEEILVAGEDGYREAKDFMRMLMPSHARNVQPYRDSQPIFARNGVESQLDAMFSPQVTLRSGGYIVINQTEALVAIDVNSGRSTREHNIEDTALQTNLEASDEVARQLRLRDLAGLIVIDYIDMEEKRNNRSVERKLKDALKNDRARIQVGHISHFGLMEMSRQRIRSGVLESTMDVCPHCHGVGRVRSPSSVALHVLRSLEDQLLKGVTHDLTLRARTAVALYILNQKRGHLSELEQRFGLDITVLADESVTAASHYTLEKGEPVGPRPVVSPTIQPTSVQPSAYDDDDDEPIDAVAEDEAEPTAEDDAEMAARDEADGGEDNGTGDENGAGENGDRKRRRRRRRRRGGEGNGVHGDATGDEHAEAAERSPRPERTPMVAAEPGSVDDAEFDEAMAANESSPDGNGEGETADGEPKRRRRGRRGGRRARRDERPAEGEAAPLAMADEGEDAVARSYEIAAALTGDEAPPLADEAAPEPTFLDEPKPVMPPPERRPEPEPEPEPVAARPEPELPPPPPPVEVDDGRPRRAGWWQRRGFF